MTKIIERMANMDDWPEWAVEACDEGRLFRTCMEHIATLEARVKELETSLNRHKDNVCRGRMEELEEENEGLRSELRFKNDYLETLKAASVARTKNVPQ